MTAAVLLLSCPPELGGRLRAATDALVEELSDAAALVARVTRSPADVAVVVVGADVPAPVEVAQRLGTVDGQLAVLLLSPEDLVAERGRDLQFAPFLGEDVSCRSHTRPEIVARAALAAADRTLRRRAHRATMSSAAAQLGSGPQLTGGSATAQSLGTLLEQAPVGVVTLDDQARVVSVNRYAERLLEADAAALARRPLVEAFPEDDQPRLSVMLMPSTPLFPSPTRRFRRERQNGRTLELDITAARFQSAIGLRGTILLLQDVTEAASTARERQRHVRALQDGVIETLSAARQAASDGDADRAGRLIDRAIDNSRSLAAQLEPALSRQPG